MWPKITGVKQKLLLIYWDKFEEVAGYTGEQTASNLEWSYDDDAQIEYSQRVV